MPSERLRNQLTMMSLALDKAILTIQPDVVKVGFLGKRWGVGGGGGGGGFNKMYPVKPEDSLSVRKRILSIRRV